jgi:hypothetical protein
MWGMEIRIWFVKEPMVQSTNSGIPCQVNENKIPQISNVRIKVHTNVNVVKG